MASVKMNYNKSGELISFRIKVYRGRDATGKELQPYLKTVKIPKNLTKKQTDKFIEREKVLFEEACKHGYSLDDKTPFSKYADYVLSLKEKEGLKTSTLTRYKELLNRINTHIGHIKLTAIRPSHLNQMYAAFAEPGQNLRTGKGLSSKTIVEHHRLVSTILQNAYRESLIKDNPASRAKPPKLQKTNPNYYQINDIKEIRKYADQEPLKWKTLIYLLLTSGCRRGEVLGLKWANVDFINSTIFINNTILYDAKIGIYEETPKSHSSIRYIKIPELVMEMLKEHKAYQVEESLKYGSSWIETDYVFTKILGGPMHPDSVTDYINKFCKKYHLKHGNPHAFRHSLASVLISSGTDILTTSHILGHAQPSHTSDIYSHVIDEATAKAADTITNKILV